MIKFENLYFSYNKNSVIKNLSFEIKSGQILALLGHNGAGKTTIFRLMLGLVSSDKGQVTINNQLSNEHNYISFLPENNGIYENLSAYENLEFRARLANINVKNIRQYSNELLEKFNLRKKCNEQVYTWSNGMKKRLALACAMISKPKLLILDEPTNGIDPESLEILIDVIKELHNNGVTIVFSSHNLDFVSKISTQIMIIQDGQKVFYSDLDQLQDPLNKLYLKYTRDM